MKHIFVPVMALPAAQMGAPQIMHLAPFFLAARDSRSAQALAEKFATTKSSIYRRRDHALRKLKSILGNA